MRLGEVANRLRQAERETQRRGIVERFKPLFDSSLATDDELAELIDLAASGRDIGGHAIVAAILQRMRDGEERPKSPPRTSFRRSSGRGGDSPERPNQSSSTPRPGGSDGNPGPTADDRASPDITRRTYGDRRSSERGAEVPAATRGLRDKVF